MATDRRFSAHRVQLKWSVFDHEADAWLDDNLSRGVARWLARELNADPRTAARYQWVPRVREMEVASHGA